MRVFLNNCAHRGVKVCRADSGHAKTLIYPYHGWTYDTAGKLLTTGFDDFYAGKLDKAAHGLKPVAQIDTHGGLIFAAWHAGAPIAGNAALHLLTVGTIRGLILAMMARVILGHTSGPLRPPRRGARAPGSSCGATRQCCGSLHADGAPG